MDLKDLINHISTRSGATSFHWKPDGCTYRVSWERLWLNCPNGETPTVITVCSDRWQDRYEVEHALLSAGLKESEK